MSSSSSGGVGFCGLLTCVFVAAKLFGKIAWSWWWVFAPIWIPFAFGLSLMAIAGIGYVIVTLWENRGKG